MTDALGLECLRIAEELAALSARTDAARAEAEAAVRARLAPLAARAQALRASVEREGDARRAALALRARLLVDAIERVDARPAVALADTALPRDLAAELSAACADLAAALREAPPPPTHRPANHARSITHVASGVGTLGLLRVIPTHTGLLLASGAFMALAWTLEVTRARSPRWNAVLMKLLGAIAHPHEWVRVNSSTWYGTALFLIAAMFSVPACAVGVAVLAVGDPAAGYAGRRWGRTRIRHGRSLEGSMAFVGAGTLAATAALWVFNPVSHAMSLGSVFTHALVGAVAGAVIELVSTRLDDNLTIPLAAAGAAALSGL